MNLRSTVEGAALRLLTSLPAPLQRGVSGGRTVLDGQTLAADLQLMLAAQRLLRGRGEEAPIEEVRAGTRRDAAIAGGRQPIGEVRELEIAGRPARHYLPTVALTAGGEPGPLLMFVHGGGFIEGDVDTHDAPCRALAERSGVPVLSVSYRLAPEHPFPSAHDDAYAAFRDVHAHAVELGADPARIAVGGDSAGGNLAGWVAIAAARDGLPVAFQLLVYPVADGPHPGASARMFNEGFYLTQEFMDRADACYTPDRADLLDERISLVRAELPAGLAPAYVATAGFDPLRDEGESYARLLAAAGHQVELERFPDQIHGFLNMLVVPSCGAAVDTIAQRLRAAFA
ncbi:MAG TPA: alpha/beta hydrolase [Nocardioides sp.]|nr:alpha/beta hydrolase [Nocardioides sp.]